MFSCPTGTNILKLWLAASTDSLGALSQSFNKQWVAYTGKISPWSAVNRDGYLQFSLNGKLG